MPEFKVCASPSCSACQEVRLLRARLAAIQERHSRSTVGDWCLMEGQPYPCPDRQDADALLGERRA